MSRRDFFITNYSNFQNEVFQIINTNIFPSLNDVDICDVIYLFQHSFGNVSKYDDIIVNLLNSNGIKLAQNQLTEIMPICKKYIDQIKLVL